jgi:hypothetical protein
MRGLLPLLSRWDKKGLATLALSWRRRGRKKSAGTTVARP